MKLLAALLKLFLFFNRQVSRLAKQKTHLKKIKPGLKELITSLVGFKFQQSKPTTGNIAKTPAQPIITKI